MYFHMENIKLWEILVPCQKNDGTGYSTKHHREWDKQVLRITGGLTVLKPTTGGYWVDHTDNGNVYKDRTIPVRIACNNTQMDEIIRRTLTHYSDQEAIMAYVISDRVKIVRRGQEGMRYRPHCPCDWRGSVRKSFKDCEIHGPATTIGSL